MMNRNIWVTSDTHFHHKNIVRGTSSWVFEPKEDAGVQQLRDFDTLEEHDRAYVTQRGSYCRPSQSKYQLMTPIEVIESGNRKLEIYLDEDAQSPDEWDGSSFIVYDHRSFFLEKKGFDSQEVYEAWSEGKKLFNRHWIFPLYAYIHSGVALSLSRDEYPFTCPWDVSFKGFVLVKRQKYAWKKEEAYQQASSLVSSWNTYLSGQVYGFQLYEDGEETDACWGYYGEGGLEEIKSMLKSEMA